MKANELRIGNLVESYDLCNCYNDRIPFYGLHIYSVRQINTWGVRVDIGFDAVQKLNYDEIEPILLTGEFLVKFGFDHKSGNEYIKDRFVYRKQQTDLVINGFEYDYNGILAYPKYVHELQNLYFALTGEELVYNADAK